MLSNYQMSCNAFQGVVVYKSPHTPGYREELPKIWNLPGMVLSVLCGEVFAFSRMSNIFLRISSVGAHKTSCVTFS